MKIFLDTSDVNVIKHHYQTGLFDGVTTNPTLMMQAGRNLEVISEISSVFSGRGYHIGSISAEVVADSAKKWFYKLNSIILLVKILQSKVPCTYEGLKACKELSGI